jgi:hypothetical protein
MCIGVDPRSVAYDQSLDSSYAHRAPLRGLWWDRSRQLLTQVNSRYAGAARRNTTRGGARWVLATGAGCRNLRQVGGDLPYAPRGIGDPLREALPACSANL